MTDLSTDFDPNRIAAPPSKHSSPGAFGWVVSILEGLVAALLVVGITWSLVEVAKRREHLATPSFKEPKGVVSLYPYRARLPTGVVLSPSPSVTAELTLHAEGKPLEFGYFYGREVMKEWRTRYLARSAPAQGQAPTAAEQTEKCVWRFRADADSYHLEVTARAERSATELYVLVGDQKIGLSLPNRLEMTVAKNVAVLATSGEQELALAIPAGVEIHQIRLVPLPPGK